MMATVGRKALTLAGTLLGVWALGGCQVMGGGGGSDPDPAVYLSEARQRLDARSQSVYDGLGLAGEVQVNDIQSTGCYTTTLSLKEELNGLGMEHRWQIKDVAEADAGSADRRMRERMRADGWEVVYDRPGSRDGVAGVNVRFKDPETKDSLNLSWWPTARSLSVTQYVNCTPVDGDRPGAHDLVTTWDTDFQGVRA
ncbi:hypothetical protein ACH492_24535 [Streptomyces sp. NPDC019443]|uniref:hypothetical protein n=1 Tax=Streptomyces sp. NPDC019443 TaxID=3365061 RepID=UPI0037AD5E1A